MEDTWYVEIALQTDRELLAQWRGGDLAAADQLISRHFGALARFFRTKVGLGVEDLIQQTLLTCVQRSASFPIDWEFRTFLFVVARDQLYMHYRKRARRPEFLPHEVSVADLDPSPSTIEAKRATDRVLLAALRQLPIELQVLVELHYWEACSGPELARILAVPEGTVRSRLARARSLLRVRVEQIEAGHGTALGTDAEFDSWVEAVRGCVDAGS